MKIPKDDQNLAQELLNREKMVRYADANQSLAFQLPVIYKKIIMVYEKGMQMRLLGPSEIKSLICIIGIRLVSWIRSLLNEKILRCSQNPLGLSYGSQIWIKIMN